ncbi:MAG TPA: hypothetical protein VMV69_30110 [Pirellulales bacterium]|nr:hypothetical protein [Pirellulales bacterium]
MCRLREFDVRSRAIATLVDDWRLQQAIVRSIWKLDDLLKLAIEAVDSASKLDANGFDREFGAQGGTSEAQVDRDQATDALEYFVAGLRKLTSSVNTIDEWVGIFEHEGHQLENATAFRQSSSSLAGVVAKHEAAIDAQWEELDRQSLSSEEMLEGAACLRSSEQASA